jgi:hypothetical protein
MHENSISFLLYYSSIFSFCFFPLIPFHFFTLFPRSSPPPPHIFSIFPYHSFPSVPLPFFCIIPPAFLSLFFYISVSFLLLILICFTSSPFFRILPSHSCRFLCLSSQHSNSLILSHLSTQALSNKHITCTKRRDQMITTPASYSGRTCFKSRPGDRLP